MKPSLTVVSVVLVSFYVILQYMLVAEGLAAQVTSELAPRDVTRLLSFDSGLTCAGYNIGDCRWGCCGIIRGLIEGNIALVNN